MLIVQNVLGIGRDPVIGSDVTKVLFMTSYD
jgi:hypothetical protein